MNIYVYTHTTDLLVSYLIFVFTFQNKLYIKSVVIFFTSNTPTKISDMREHKNHLLKKWQDKPLKIGQQMCQY